MLERLFLQAMALKQRGIHKSSTVTIPRFPKEIQTGTDMNSYVFPPQILAALLAVDVLDFMQPRHEQAVLHGARRHIDAVYTQTPRQPPHIMQDQCMP
jgi:hypothetical protein